MLRTLQTARQSMHFEQTRIDILANNLANAATSGFRQVLTRVTEKAAGLNSEPDEMAPAERQGQGIGAEAAPVDLRGAQGMQQNRPLLMTQAVDTRPGIIEATGRNLDLALSGRGFFVVRDLEGNEFYTRDGSFNLDSNGNLVTAGGLQVQGSGGPVQAGGGLLTVDNDGTVLVDGQERGRLRIVDFVVPNSLEPRGDGGLRALPDHAPEEVPAGRIAVLQGHLEGSNVDAVRTLVDMIAAQRAFEIGAKVLQANDETLSQTVNTLGRVT